MGPDPKHIERWREVHRQDQARDVMRWEGIVSGLLLTTALAAIAYVLYVVLW